MDLPHNRLDAHLERPLAPLYVVLATVFVSLPLVVRAIVPVLEK